MSREVELLEELARIDGRRLEIKRLLSELSKGATEPGNETGIQLELPLD